MEIFSKTKEYNYFSEPIRTSNGIELKVRPLTVRESISVLQEKETKTPFNFIKHILQQITTLQNNEIEIIDLSDAITIILFYRINFFDNLELSTSPSILPTNFINSNFNPNAEDIKIGDFKYTPKITLSQANDAYLFSKTQGDSDLLTLYLIASCSDKILKESVDNILNSINTVENRLQINKFAACYKNSNTVKIDLLYPNHYDEIVIVAEGGVSDYAYFFQQIHDLNFAI